MKRVVSVNCLALSARHYGWDEWEYQDSQPVEVLDCLSFGSIEAAMNRDACISRNITHVLIVAKEIYPFYPTDFLYKRVEVDDDEEEPLIAFLDECIQFIETARKDGGKCLVLCRGGISRSASVAIGYLMYKHGATFDQAFSYVLRLKPSICPNEGFIEQLKLYYMMGCTTVGASCYHQFYFDQYFIKASNYHHKRKHQLLESSKDATLKRGKTEWYVFEVDFPTDNQKAKLGMMQSKEVMEAERTIEG